MVQLFCIASTWIREDTIDRSSRSSGSKPDDPSRCGEMLIVLGTKDKRKR
jgi:hypothetical protein